MSILYTAKCTLKIHNSTSHTVGVVITHQKNIIPVIRDEIFEGTTSDSPIEIEDHEHGELHLVLKSVRGDLSTEELGTFKCDDLKFPSDSNAIGSPSNTIDVTSTTYNSAHDESEIHFYVR